MKGFFERLDPRTRLLAIAAAIVIVTSTPAGALRPFPFYGVAILMLLGTGRASWIHLALRCLAASPFILMAGGLLAWQDGTPAAGRLALSVALKGYSAALLLAFLTATTSLGELLTALRLLKAPQSLNLILGMMYRYTSLFSEEYARMERARACRTVRPLGRRRFSIYGHQFGSLILRSWDRAERVHAAMVSRGFHGSWPSRLQPVFTPRDALFLAAAPALLLIPRLW